MGHGFVCADKESIFDCTGFLLGLSKLTTESCLEKSFHGLINTNKNGKVAVAI
jgi:hypothetical protein